MTLFRRLILAFALIAGITPAMAQVPPPVPALPDTERRTTYSISASLCTCAVNFQIYGDGIDVANWLEVYLNGVPIPASGNWTITSPTGSLATIPRPITDAVLTFTNTQTGTVQIVGARRPRRASQFNEGGVTARSLNQALTDIIAQNRETWDKTNDVSGRAVLAPPGETLALLPALASRQNTGACFDNGGSLTSCVAVSGSFIAGAGITFTGSNPITVSCNIFTTGLSGCVPASGGGTANFLQADGTFQPVVKSIVAAPSTLTGSVTLVPGNGTSITPSGQNVTVGNTLQIVSITDAAYGAKCNGVFTPTGSSQLSITSGTPNLTSNGSLFTSADVGKSIFVPGAGVAGAGLSTTILSFTNTTNVVLATNASTTLSLFLVTPTAYLAYGTDDTAAIQAAMNATPNGGILDIPAGAATGGQTSGGCLIKKQGANNYALLQDHPFNIRGHGHFSNLMTDPSIPSTVDDLLVNVGAFDWANTVWENFSIGDSPSFLPATLLMYTRHGKRGLALVDTTSVAFIGTIIRNMTIGESGNDYSIFVGNASGGGTSKNLIMSNQIWGGIRLNNVADSNRVIYNTLQGSSTFGGVFEFVAGAGKFEFSGNNVTWAGGFKVESGFAPVVRNNYFEELFSTSESNNALVDFNGGIGTISWPSFTGNITSASVSSTSTPVRYANSTGGNFGDNTITTSTNRTGVTSVTSLSCIAPNLWTLAGGAHFSTALANSYGGC